MFYLWKDASQHFTEIIIENLQNCYITIKKNIFSALLLLFKFLPVARLQYFDSFSMSRFCKTYFLIAFYIISYISIGLPHLWLIYTEIVQDFLQLKNFWAQVYRQDLSSRDIFGKSFNWIFYVISESQKAEEVISQTWCCYNYLNPFNHT